MARGKASGIRLDRDDVAIVLGMQARDDRDHDIAAWFGVNQGRVAEAKDGRYAHIRPAPADQLPPKGPPGLKGRRLRAAVDRAITHLENEEIDRAIEILHQAANRYDEHER